MGSDTEDSSLRYRRAQSVTRAEELADKEKKARSSQIDKPCHIPRDSLFSWSSEFANFTGLVNWGFLMLSIGGVRLFLENVIKYGIRVNPLQWITFITGQGENKQYPTVVLVIFSLVPAIASLLIEKATSVAVISNNISLVIQISNMLFLITLPVIVIHFRGHEFTFAGRNIICMVYLILFLKLWSYVQVNYWCRMANTRKSAKSKLRRQSISAPNYNELLNAEQDQSSSDEKSDDGMSEKIVRYPDNLHVKDLMYFLLAPTLCYELNFPRTTRIRKRFVIKRFLEVLFGVNLILALFQQWLIPSISNSLVPFSEMDFMRSTERLLKLSVPNHLIWLCFFYLTFHSFLNLVGELMHFADRNFYNDWWNAKNMDVFWRTWNMPVHLWAVRHVYIPTTDLGYGKTTASAIVFFISAFFHEYLVSVPLQMFRIWAFLGMMLQVPLSQISRFTEKKISHRWGNIIVWSSLIIGQPLIIMMYYHDYALAYMETLN